MATPSSNTADDAARSYRLPPQSIEAEQSLLGGLMLDNSMVDEVTSTVNAEDFYRRDHAAIFRAICALCEENQPADVVTVSEWLENVGDLNQVGGLSYLGALAQNTPNTSHITAYARIVRERALLRRLISAANEIVGTSYQPEGRSPTEVLDHAEQLIFEISQNDNRRTGGFVPIKGLLKQTIDHVEHLYHTKQKVTGVATGFNDLDEMMSGLQRSDLIIVAGRPSMGKTALAMCFVEHAAIDLNLPVAFFSMEMPGSQLSMRLLASLSRVNAQRLRTGNLHDDDWPRLTSTLGMLADKPIYIDDTPALSPLELRSRARRLAREHGLGLIVVDYLQLMQSHEAQETRATEISNITRSLKVLAKELNVPLVALSQLNRSLESRTDKRPVMSDLRECVTGDTLVVLADGRRVPIRELVGLTPEVVSVDESGKLCRAASDKVWKVGTRPVYEIKLASGRSIKATARHRLMTAGGWSRVESLAEGDRLAISRALPEPGSNEARLSVEDTNVYMRLTGTYGGALSAPAIAARAESDLFWDRIVSIEPCGEEEVYDLTVPGPESWLADGIVSHNSGAIEQDADVILFIYRDEVYHEDSKDKGIAEVIIGKQRNGPVGRVRMTFLGEYTRFENYAPESAGYYGGPE